MAREPEQTQSAWRRSVEARADSWVAGKWTKFAPVDWEVLPEVPAVYAIFFDGELVYIGQSANLRGRFMSHRFRHGYARNFHTPWGVLPDTVRITAKAKRSRRYGDWAMIELRLIRRLKPRLNATFVRGRKDARVA